MQAGRKLLAVPRSFDRQRIRRPWYSRSGLTDSYRDPLPVVAGVSDVRMAANALI